MSKEIYYQLPSIGTTLRMDGTIGKLPGARLTLEEIEVWKMIGLLPDNLDVSALERIEFDND